jgi:IclR family transcriptional regulator, acetate operon repressor
MKNTRRTATVGKSEPAKKTQRTSLRTVNERGDQVQSLVRALNILNRLAETDDGITLTEIGQQVGLSPSTTHRLLTTLQQERYVQFNSEQKLWSVGVQAFASGNAFLKTRNLVTAARPHMRSLMEESEETINLAVEDQYEAIYLSQVECKQMMRAFARPGGRVPLHCSSVGKALLSAMAESELAKVLHHKGLARVTIKTINTTKILREDLLKTRLRGYAIDDEEHAVGLRCIASVIFNEASDAIAAISLSGPMARIPDERIPLLGDLVRRKADAITSQIGGNVPLWRR